MILLVSGGLDSYIAGKYLEAVGHSIQPLFINYAGSYTHKEENICKRLYPNLLIDDTINFSDAEIGNTAFIQNRNAYFALIASKYQNLIAMGGLKDDNVGDKSPAAFLAMQHLLNIINPDSNYVVLSPFWRKTKSDIIRDYLKSGCSVDKLLQTTSCYHPVKHFCGKCPSCFRKWCAFSDNQIANTLPMFNNNDLVETYLGNISSYDISRQQSIKDAAEKLGVS